MLIVRYTRIGYVSFIIIIIYLAYLQHNTTDTEHVLIMNARTPVIPKLVEATGRPLKLHNNFYF